MTWLKCLHYYSFFKACLASSIVFIVGKSWGNLSKPCSSSKILSASSTMRNTNKWQRKEYYFRKVDISKNPLVTKFTSYEPDHDKPSKMTCVPAKTQISLGIPPTWSESSLCPLCVAKDPNLLQEDSEDSNQTQLMCRLIWIFAGYTGHFVSFVVHIPSFWFHQNSHDCNFSCPEWAKTFSMILTRSYSCSLRHILRLSESPCIKITDITTVTVNVLKICTVKS